MDGEENPYLAMRREKIARNEARMRELGLLKVAKRVTRSSKPLVKMTAPSSTAIVTAKDQAPRRRSSRLRSSPQSILEEPGTKPAVVRSTANRKRPRSIRTPPTAPPLSVHPSHSARSMTLDVSRLVHSIIGMPMEYTGKAFVMEESARLAVDDFTEGNKISFNKYCGVQEWGNDALFLWVNLDAPNSEVVNDFLDNGRQVTWFGGSRMHDGTTVVRKLLKVGSEESRLSSAMNGIVLWCRQYVKEKKSFSSYVCLGRLSLVSYNPDAHPLAFVWSLLDYDSIVNHNSERVKETFRNLSRSC